MNKLFSLSLCGFLLLVVGCAQKEVKPVISEEIENIKNSIDEYNSSAAKEKAIQDRIAEIKKNKLKIKEENPENRFNLTTDKLNAKLFFMSLVSGTDENIVIHPDVSGTISLDLKDVTIRNVLDVVRDVYGFDYKYNGSIYTIFPKEFRTEIFPINYLNVKRVGVSDTSVLTGNVESSSQYGSNSNSYEQMDLVGAGSTISPGSRIQTRSETNFWESLKVALSELVGVEGATDSPRKVITNPQTGMVIVTGMPSELAAVREFLDKARLSVKRQVIIEAKILEIELNNDYQAGVNWNEINGQLLLGKNASEFSSPTSINEISESVGEVFSSLVRISDTRRLLSLLETQGELQVLSSPRVSTVNNQKAVIRVGTDEFFVTGVSNSTISNASSTTSSPDIELSSFFSGISLDVTPQISDGGSVILHIHPVVSTVTEEQKDIIVGDEAFSLPLALRDIRESDSIVKAESGQVIVLGGLMQERIEDTKGRRPGLSQVPVVNGLFNTRLKNKKKSELIILLKPIVIEQGSWVDDVAGSSQRIGNLKESF